MNQNGVHPELLVRNIGKVDNILLNKFIQGFSDYCEAGHHMRLYNSGRNGFWSVIMSRGVIM